MKQNPASPIQFKTITPPFLVALALVLACFVFSAVPNAFGVSPAPDGGYPGGNTAEGQSALLDLTTGGYNTAVGYFSLRGDTTSSFNTAIGAGTLLANTADENTATGAGALFSNTTGGFNTASGGFALFSNGIGTSNTATGTSALFSNSEGTGNTASGAFALQSNTTGSFNTANGFFALQNNTAGVRNTALGNNAGTGVTTANDVICIGSNVGGANVSNSCYIGQIFGATSSAGAAVFVNSDGKLGTSTSSRRFKKEIKPMEQASETIFALKPVTFRYKKGIDPQGIPQFGLVAEDVEEVNPDLVVRDKEGNVNTVRYDAVNAMLLNEFLKQHRTVLELKSTVQKQQNDFQSRLADQRKEFQSNIAHQQKQIEALTTGLQKVSDELELRKPVWRTVLNKQ